MRRCECTQCGSNFQEDDADPSVHYSQPSTICLSCTTFNAKKPGDWYQTSSGAWVRK